MPVASTPTPTCRRRRRTPTTRAATAGPRRPTCRPTSGPRPPASGERQAAGVRVAWSTTAPWSPTRGRSTTRPATAGRDLPAANNAVYRGGGGCGMYRIGGSTGRVQAQPFSEVLPGYDQCGGGADVPWLSEDPASFDVAPGQTVTVSVGMDSSQVDQPGTYDAKLGRRDGLAVLDHPIGVEMDVTPPKSWGKIRGTVTNAATGAPIPGATVDICTMYDGSRRVTAVRSSSPSRPMQTGTTSSGSPRATTRCRSSRPRTATRRRARSSGSRPVGPSTADFALKKS